MIGSSLFFLASLVPQHRVMTNAVKTARLSNEKEFNRTWKEKADNLWRGASKRKKKIRSTRAAWKRTEHYIGEAEGKKSNLIF